MSPNAYRRDYTTDKPTERRSLEALTEAYLAAGNQITLCRKNQSGLPKKPQQPKKEGN